MLTLRTGITGIDRLPKKYKARLENYFSDERYDNQSYLDAYGNRVHLHDGLWLSTAQGWRSGDDHHLHTIHEWTVKDLLKKVREVVPCEKDCPRCFPDK